MREAIGRAAPKQAAIEGAAGRVHAIRSTPDVAADSWASLARATRREEGAGGPARARSSAASQTPLSHGTS